MPTVVCVEYLSFLCLFSTLADRGSSIITDWAGTRSKSRYGAQVTDRLDRATTGWTGLDPFTSHDLIKSNNSTRKAGLVLTLLNTYLPTLQSTRV